MKTAVIVLVIIGIITLSTSGKQFVCDENKTYQENKCNTCRCAVVNNELVFGCTKIACSTPEYRYFRNCNPRNPIPCDNCWCLPPWGIICEL